MIKTKRKIAKQIFSFILALSMMMCGLPSTVFAETTEAGSGEEAVALAVETGSKPSLDIADGDIKISEGTVGNLTVEIGGTTIEYSANEPIVITGTTVTNLIAVHSGNPTVVLQDCIIRTMGSPFTIQSGSSVNLKLEGHNLLKTDDGEAGIRVPSGASVTIDGSGILEVDGGTTAAAIGGREGESGGTITINGGTVIARAGSWGAGIGGGFQAESGGAITITGGTVKASGSYGAGIGGGCDGNSGTILITGGTIEASTDEAGAGIGGGYYGNGENITIAGGKITAKGGTDGAGIGGGSNGSGGEITITGGTIEASTDAVGAGAGIGGGYCGNGENIKIAGGKITAKGGNDGAGIGGGCQGTGGEITITGGTIEANGRLNGAGIGGGSRASGGMITIHGGTVTAKGESYGAGIGGGCEGAGGTITIHGGSVKADSCYWGAGIGGGFHGSGGDVTIHGGMVIASGVLGAGIGGGDEGAGGNVTITGGNVNPYSSKGKHIGAGVGATDHGTLTDGNGNRVAWYALTLDGVTEPVSVTAISGTTYGLKDVSTLNINKLYFYLPDGANVDTITAGGKDYTCKDMYNTYYTAHDWSKKDGVCVHCSSECNHSTITGDTCDTCGKSISACDHVQGEILYTGTGEYAPDCVNGGLGHRACTKCHAVTESSIVVAALGHNYKSEVTKEPTTTSTGVRTYTCERCGHSYTETIAKLPEATHNHSYTETVTGQADCSNAGVKTYSCSCGDSYTENIPALGHRYISRVTTEATTTAEGIMTYICDRCGHRYTKSIEQLSADGQQGNADKSNNSNLENDNQMIYQPLVENQLSISKPTNSNKPSNNNPQASSGKPYIEGKSDQNGWENIKEQLKETTTGATVAMNGTSVVPGTVLDTIKGKDVSVVFNMDEGITWTVNGKDITAEKVGDIDFGVTVGEQIGNTIPVDIINEVTGERYSMNVSLAYDGEFGFRAILTLNAGKENAGLFANLFYYNLESGALEYICASQIDADGNANLEFTHASDYVVVVDEENLQATETDRDDDISATPENGEISADTEETTAGNSWWFIVIGAIVVIAGLGIFFVAKKTETEK